MLHKRQTGEVHSVLAGDTREKDHLEDLGIDSIMLEWIIKKCNGRGMDWIGLAEDRDS